ncbi:MULTISPECIES: hypothetical protein [unclassified Pseudomonas]|uniref:hypothetical protein n=1 Tax=unclassified Pseudomonas TaxID=196821 RepID=UPI000A1E1AAD|nr:MULTISPECIES: hypothetical protein [unclassified Pseudomonas]
MKQEKQKMTATITQNDKETHFVADSSFSLVETPSGFYVRAVEEHDDYRTSLYLMQIPLSIPKDGTPIGLTLTDKPQGDKQASGRYRTTTAEGIVDMISGAGSAIIHYDEKHHKMWGTFRFNNSDTNRGLVIDHGEFEVHE